jgi:hypothetical protein
VSTSETKALESLGRSGHDPRSAADFLAALEAEAERSSATTRERWRFAAAASPDEHRRRARRQLWRSTP